MKATTFFVLAAVTLGLTGCSQEKSETIPQPAGASAPAINVPTGWNLSAFEIAWNKAYYGGSES